MAESDESRPAAHGFVTAALAVVLLAAVYILIPFDQAIPVGPREEITAHCGPSILWVGRRLPQSFPSQHDRFRFVECRFDGWVRSLKAAGIAGVAWLVACIVVIGSRRGFPSWQAISLRFGTLFAAVVASIVTVAFGIATAANPYNDLSRAYTMMFALAGGIAALTFWVLFSLLRKKLASRDERRPSAVGA